jgi:hypothetical protein
MTAASRDENAGGPASLRARLKQLAKDGWAVLKPTLEIVKDASSGVPFLEPALSGLLAIIERIEVRCYGYHMPKCLLLRASVSQTSSDAQEDLHDFVAKLAGIASILTQCKGSLAKNVEESLEQLAR